MEKIKVGIYKSWDEPNLLIQSEQLYSKNVGRWKNMIFTYDLSEPLDVIVFLSPPEDDFVISCRKNSRLFIFMEPPIERYNFIKKLIPYFDYMIGPFNFKNDKCCYSHGFLPWWTGKSYNFLKSVDYKTIKSKKMDRIIAVVSKDIVFKEQLLRKNFIDFLLSKNQVPIDLFGNGYSFLPVKYDKEVEYKYSLAIENVSTTNYWTEKISDAFLAFNMPLYYGAKNISQYFPLDSFIQLDLSDFELSKKTILNAIKEDIYSANFEYIVEARNLILEKYNIIPYLYNFITDNLPDIKKRKIVSYSFKKVSWKQEGNIVRRIVNYLKKI